MSREAELRKELAPTGVLRSGINLANFLLVTGKSSDGAPQGVAPDLAAEVAKRLRCEVSYVPFQNPEELGDAVDADVWDIGLIGAEPQRAEKISFTAAYVEISATYMVPADSSLKCVADVDTDGVCIASVGGSTFGLWLDKNIRHAKVLHASSMDAALELLTSGKANALAGLRSRLLSDAQKAPGATILDGHYMTVQQAIGMTRKRATFAAEFLAEVVEELKASGFVGNLIDKHGMTGKLVVAPAVSNGDSAADEDSKRRRVD